MNKKIFLMLTLLIWSTVNIKAQVTIGSLEPPAASAVLDLNSGGNGNKGLLLPRVNLDSDTDDYTIDKPEEGLLVYATGDKDTKGDCLGLAKGIYVWNGEKWQTMGNASNTDDGEPVFKTDMEHTIKVFSIIIDPVINRAINGDANAIGKRWHEYFVHPTYGYRWNDPRDLALQYQREMEKASGGTIKFEVTQIEADTAWMSTPGEQPYSMQQLEDFMTIDNPFWDTYEDGRYPIGASWHYKDMVEYYGLDTKRDADEVYEVWVFGPPITSMYESCHVSQNGLWCNGSATTNVSNTKILTVLGYNYERGLAEMVHDNVHRAENMLKYAYNGVWRTDYDRVVPEDVELNNWELYSIYDRMLQENSQHKSSFGNCHYPPTATYNYDYYSNITLPSYAYAWKDYPYINLDKREPQSLNSMATWGCTQEGFMLWWFTNLPNKEGINPADGRLNNWWLYIFDYDYAKDADSADNVY